MTVSTRVIKVLLHSNERPFIEIESGLRVQVLPDISHLARCQKHQFAAFIADRGLLVVWEDKPRNVLNHADSLQDKIMRMAWKNQSAYPDDVKEEDNPLSTIANVDVSDFEESHEEIPRRIVLVQPILTAVTLLMVVLTIGANWREVAIEIYVDRNFSRIAFIAAILPQLWLALFFFQALSGNIAQLIGPIGQMQKNTKFYSGIAPRRLSCQNRNLPHVTIQMPVYKEGLRAVIEPTILSIKAAISTYEMQGGTANIFINDDGMQLISKADAHERQDFYDEHHIGWVARPGHNLTTTEVKSYFNRRGKFKKASNMNYALWVSNRVESKLSEVNRTTVWSEEDEERAFKSVLQEVIKEDEGRTMADGNIRLGDYILLIDSDTRVPTDCLLDAVSELELSPQVAILQQSSGVMNVTSSFFEHGITFFTNLVYTQIEYAVANGDVAPFVGHNAFLRWSAVQDIAYDCPDDDREKYWSEATVSEDFDMALRLQTSGYIVRLGAYSNKGFKEGVSLRVYDELARWEKYAYGCNELIFHPIKDWPFRGPFTKLFKNFVRSNMPLPSKLTILAYIGTYYALGSSWLLSLANYFLVGWFNGHLDHFYMDSFKVYFGIIVVFTALGNVSLAVLRYRVGERSLFGALFENFCWIPMMAIFLGGISLHVSQAILCHMFSIDMSWGATAKEVEDVSFFEEIPRVILNFKWTFMFCILATLGMVLCATLLPFGWRIDFLTPIWPLGSVVVCHFLLPIILNPNLMLFTW